MLRIGDIHITTQYADNILAELRKIVSDSGEREIIFLGDYVYHFSYDRKALLGLMDFFVELTEDGKRVYVLAGNHDRLQGHFVFQEAQRVVESLAGGQIVFVTEPTWKKIEDQWILFLPWSPAIRAIDPQGGSHTYQTLIQSSHKNEQLSGHINRVLEEMLEQRPTSDSIMIAHHFYVADTTFPGQKGRFSYKSVSLDPAWCDREGVLLISGHIHKPFVWKHYLCLGSVWATHPQESNQAKVVLRIHDGKAELMPSQVNFFASIAYQQDRITLENIQSVQQQAREELSTTMSGGDWDLQIPRLSYRVPADQTTLQLQVDTRSYQSMDERVDHGLQSHLRDVQLQTLKKSYTELVSDLAVSHQELRESYVQRKTLLEDYVRQKYPDEGDEYVDILQDVGVL